MLTQEKLKEVDSFFKFDRKAFDAAVASEQHMQFLQERESTCVRLYKHKRTNEEVRVIEVADLVSLGVIENHFGPLEDLGLVRIHNNITAMSVEPAIISHLSPSGAHLWRQEFHPGNIVVMSNNPFPRAEVVRRRNFDKDYEALYPSIDQAQLFRGLGGCPFYAVKYTQNNLENHRQIVKFFERNHVEGVELTDGGSLFIEKTPKQNDDRARSYLEPLAGEWIIGDSHGRAHLYTQQQVMSLFQSFDGYHPSDVPKLGA